MIVGMGLPSNFFTGIAAGPGLGVEEPRAWWEEGTISKEALQPSGVKVTLMRRLCMRVCTETIMHAHTHTKCTSSAALCNEREL